MRIIIAPDSFKGSLTALEVCDIVAEVARRHYPHAQIDLIPVADGGEGTVDALLAAVPGTRKTAKVTGPMGVFVTAEYGMLPEDHTAVLEMAQTSGISLVPAELRDPMKASSRGLGELILHALQTGAKRLLIGIGGSATNDGGMGMLAALGVRFYAEDGTALLGSGADLTRISHMDREHLSPLVQKAEIRVICDVTNPLTGARGATAIYGPQKGATPAMLDALEAGMRRYAKVLSKALDRAIDDVPGAGAAGGVGAALHGVLGAQLLPGIDAVLDTVGFEEKLKGADLVITGEGQIDSQSVRYGKVVAGIAARCARQKVPIVVLAGSMQEGAQDLYEIGSCSIMTSVRSVAPLEQVLAQARPLLADAADRMFRLLAMGQTLPKG